MSKLEGSGFTLISPVYVANNFLNRGMKDGIDITPLKVQKLVYFLYVDYYQKTGEKLFTERFETWSKGPVVPSIYTEFSVYGNNAIKTFARDSMGKIYVVTESGVFKECFERVWNKFKDFSGDDLSQITHRDGTAWTKARDRKSPYLSDEDILNEPEYAN